MSRRTSGLVLVHFVWATHRRRPLLPPARDGELVAMLAHECRECRSTLLAAGCADDHVHAVAALAMTVSVATLAQQLKGATSYRAKRRQPPWDLAWQDGYWVESVSPAELEPLIVYVRGQRSHHDSSHPAEGWSRHAE